MGQFANDKENQHTERVRILLVEDDKCTQEMITAVLKRIDSNMDIEVAANGDHAIKRYLEGSHHDLVITDNVHPGVLGIELIERILAENPLQPIILRTGNCGDTSKPSNKNIRTFRCWKSRIVCNSFRTL